MTENGSSARILSDGVFWFPGFLNKSAQRELVDHLRNLAHKAPFYTPTMPRTGKAMSVRMTNLGSLGWVSDKAGGYRYQAKHPQTGKPWPAMPQSLVDCWKTLSKVDYLPEAALINFYGASAKMGLHQDRDEDFLPAPVVSLSLGDTALFRIGGVEKGGHTQSIRLESGDAIVLSGAGRLCFHGIDRILHGSSQLLERSGRINITLRRVTDPKSN